MLRRAGTARSGILMSALKVGGPSIECPGESRGARLTSNQGPKLSALDLIAKNLTNWVARVVRTEGLEPSLPNGKQILSLQRLPIPPCPQTRHHIAQRERLTQLLEAGVGIEPAYTELQSAA